MRTTAIAVVVCSMLAGIPGACGSPPKPPVPVPPRPPATIVVTPEALPCTLAKMPRELGPSGSKPMAAGRWALLDETGAVIQEIDLERGVHTPRGSWDALALYILALQSIVIDAKRCHPEQPEPPVPAPAVTP